MEILQTAAIWLTILATLAGAVLLVRKHLHQLREAKAEFDKLTGEDE